MVHRLVGGNYVKEGGLAPGSWSAGPLTREGEGTGQGPAPGLQAPTQ